MTAPLSAREFVAAYSLPYLVIAIIQGLVVFGVAAALGMDASGSPLLVALVLLAMAIFDVGLGMMPGSLLRVGRLSGAYSAVLLITIFAGAWFDLDGIGGPLQTVENLLPFVHALDATRGVLSEGADFGAISTDIAWVGAYTVVAIAAAGLAFRRRMVEWRTGAAAGAPR